MLERLYIVEVPGSLNIPANLSRRIYSIKDSQGSQSEKTFTYAELADGTVAKYLGDWLAIGGSIVSQRDEGGGINSSRFDASVQGYVANDLQQFPDEASMRRYASDHGEAPHQFGSAAEVNAYISAFVINRPKSYTAGVQPGPAVPQPAGAFAGDPPIGVYVQNANAGQDVQVIPQVRQGVSLPSINFAKITTWLHSPLGVLAILASVMWFALHLSPRKGASAV